jgi:hypothetical protein
LPGKTTLLVTYGGSEQDTYELSSNVSSSFYICCEPTRGTSLAVPAVPCGPSTLADGGPPTAILCDLWTDGPAEVQVTSPGYAPLDVSLKSQIADDQSCGVVTVQTRLALIRGDGGL